MKIIWYPIIIFLIYILRIFISVLSGMFQVRFGNSRSNFVVVVADCSIGEVRGVGQVFQNWISGMMNKSWVSRSIWGYQTLSAESWWGFWVSYRCQCNIRLSIYKLLRSIEDNMVSDNHLFDLYPSNIYICPFWDVSSTFRQFQIQFCCCGGRL